MQRRTAQLTRILTSGIALAIFASAAHAQVRPNPPNPVTVDGGNTVPDGTRALFFDNFEYAVGRSESAARSPRCLTAN